MTITCIALTYSGKKCQTKKAPGRDECFRHVSDAFLKKDQLTKSQFEKLSSEEDLIGLKTFIDKSKVTVDDRFATDAFSLFSSSGNLAAVTYLADKIDFNEFEPRSIIGLQGAVSSGHFEVAKYLLTRFEYDKGKPWVWLLMLSVSGGGNGGRACNLRTFRLIYETFKPSIDDVRTCDILESAAENGHIDIVKYLFETVGLTKEDVEDDWNRALREAARYSHFEVVRYIADRMLE